MVVQLLYLFYLFLNYLVIITIQNSLHCCMLHECKITDCVCWSVGMTLHLITSGVLPFDIYCTYCKGFIMFIWHIEATPQASPIVYSCLIIPEETAIHSIHCAFLCALSNVWTDAALIPFIVFVWEELTRPAALGLAQVWLHSSTFDRHANQQAFPFSQLPCSWMAFCTPT